jgi:hypothetical protein
MTQITTQHAHVSFGPQGTSEEPVGKYLGKSNLVF